MTFFFKKLARSLCFCAPVCCIVILLPAVSIVSQPIQTRQITEKQVRISLPEQLRGSAGNTVRTEKLSGYMLNGKFVPDGQVLLNHGRTRTALQGRYRDGKPEDAWRIFYPNGQLQSEVIYRAGKPEGIARRYWADGKIAREDEYLDGELKSSRVHDKKGRLEKEFKKKNNKVIYAYLRTKKGEIIADIQNLKIRYVGFDMIPEKICRLRDDATYRCKTPYQIWRDLNTFLDPDKVLELLDDINSKYAELGLDEANKVLTQCAGDWTATPINNAGSVVQPQTQFRVQMTEPEMDSVMNACQDAQIDRIVGGGSGGTPSKQDAAYQQQVSNTKSTMEGMVAQCSQRAEFDKTQWIGVGTDTVLQVVGTLAEVGGSIAEVFHDSDGYGPWTKDIPIDPTWGITETRRGNNPPPDGSYKTSQTRAIRDIPDTLIREEEEKVDSVTQVRTVFRREYDGSGNKVEKTYVNGQLTRETSYRQSSDTSWIVVDKNYTTNSETTHEYSSRTDKWYLISSNQPIDPNKPQGAPSPSPSPSPSGTPSAGIPREDGRARDCAAMAAWWAGIAGRCDQNGWQTYDCSRIVRMLNRCVDSALIQPGPDGDLTCPVRRTTSLDESRREQCKRRKMFGTYLENSDCNFPSINERPSLNIDICNDPRAQCLPDLLIEDGLMGGETRDGERPVRR